MGLTVARKRITAGEEARVQRGRICASPDERTQRRELVFSRTRKSVVALLLTVQTQLERDFEGKYRSFDGPAAGPVVSVVGIWPDT